MKQVVYIDVLFAVNLIINYFILIAVSGILHRKDKRLRLFTGALLGALYSLFIFFPQVNFLYSSLAKLIFSVSIVAVSFKFSSIRNLLHLVIVFYIITFLFGGIIFAVWMFASPPGMLMRNGVVYVDISPVLLILLAGGCYVLLTLASRILDRNSKIQELYSVAIKVENEQAVVKAFLDTGNGLTDAISGTPVVIAEYKPLEKLFPEKIQDVFKKGSFDSGDKIRDCGWEERFRLIPYGSVGKAGGLLPAFRPDGLIVKSKNQEIKTDRVIVAVTNSKLSEAGRYEALLNPLIVK